MSAKAENQPQDSEDDIFEASPFATFEIDYNTQRFKRVNQAMCLNTGFTQQELLSMNPADLLDGESAQILQIRIKQVFAGQFIGNSFEFKLKTKAGKDYWVILNIKPKYNDGKLESALVIGFDITERKKAEEELNQANEVFENVLGHLDESFGIFDSQWRYIYLNKETEQRLGRPRSQLLGKKLNEVIPGMEATPSFAHLQLVANERHSSKWTEKSPVTGRWLEWHAFPWKDGVAVITRDITEHKIAEEALRLSEEKYRNIVDTSQEGILTTDTEGKIVYANSQIASMLGYEVKELIGKNGLDLAAEKEKKQSEQRIEKRRQGIKEKQYEIWMKTKQGSDICLLASGSPLVNAQGMYIGNLGMYTDITDRKKAEEQNRQSQKTFFEMVERSPFGIYIIDSKFCVAHMNIRSQNGAFRNVRPIIGRPFNEVMHTLWSDQVAEEIISHFRYTLETGEPYYSPQFTNLRHDAEIVESYEWELQRISLPDGYGVICYYFDSSKLRETERALIDAQAELKSHTANLERLVEERTKQLKDAERLAAIGATAGMVGHDIRNPLQAIVSDLYIAKQDLEGTPDSETKKNTLESLDSIESNIFYINKIVADLQDFARPLNPVVKDTNIRLVIAETLSNSKLLENIKIQSFVDPGLEQIAGDSDLLKRIISNLVLNAAQAMPNGGTLNIKAKVEKKTSGIVLTVEDTGVGIPEDVKNKLFTPMFTTKSKGQGFGLAVVKRMVEALGGNISYESEVGKGTKFVVHLPPPKEVNCKLSYK